MKNKIEYIKQTYNKYKYAIYSAIIFMIIAHIYYFIKRLGNEDDLNFISFISNTLIAGRWTKGTLFTGSMLAPMIKFVFSTIIISISSIIICNLFEINKKSTMIITSLILATFPSLAMSFGYLFMVEIYMMALILSILAIYLTIKYKYGFIIGSILIAFSLGNYQSYIGVAAALSIIYLIKMILDKKTTKEILIMLLKLLTTGILGIIIYFIILNGYLNYYNVTLSNYKGANSMGIPPLSKWPYLIARTYYHYFGYFLGYSFFKNNPIYKILIIITSLISLIGLIINKKIYKDKYNFILLIILIMLMPFAINIVDFVAYNTNITILNIYQYCITYILSIIVIEKYINISKKSLKNWIYTISIISLVIIGWQNFVITNQYYYKIEKFNEYTKSLNNRLLNRIETTPGYDYDMPVMIIGQKNSQFYNKLYDTNDWNNIVTFDQGLWGRFIGYIDLYENNSDAKIIKYINNQLGLNLVSASEEERNKVLITEEYNQLKTWPSVDSVKIINNILVIKL